MGLSRKFVILETFRLAYSCLNASYCLETAIYLQAYFSSS